LRASATGTFRSLSFEITIAASIVGGLASTSSSKCVATLTSEPFERLQAEYRSRSDVGVVRSGPAPRLVYPAGSDRTRSTTTSSISPAERAARIDEISDEIPELRPNAKPTITFSLTRLARETIHRELAFSRRFLEEHLGETGGWLLGERVPGKWLVSATDLGAGTRRSKQCGLNYEQVRHEVYRASLSPRGFTAWATRRDRWAGAITEPATHAGLTADVNRYRE
jgi:hypothetical protein